MAFDSIFGNLLLNEGVFIKYFTFSAMNEQNYTIIMCAIAFKMHFVWNFLFIDCSAVIFSKIE